MKRWHSLILVLVALLPAFLGANAQVQTFQTGWWWNPAKPGSGYFIEQQSNSLLLGAYFYAASGEAVWSLSIGAMNDNTYSGTLGVYSGGQTLTGAYRPDTFGGSLGNVAVQFSDPMHATITWPGGTDRIQRFSLTGADMPAPPQPGSPQSGWWWNPQQSGTGYAIEFQGANASIAAYVYDSAGNATWYIASGSMASPTRFDGAWRQYGGGETISGTWQQNSLVNANVGPVTIEFTSGSTATMTMPDGSQIPITRFNWARTSNTAASAVQPLYSGSSFWNTPIGAYATADPNSGGIIAKSIASYAANANFANTDAWGISLAYATAASNAYSVTCTMYCTGTTAVFPIPSGAQPSTGSDHHLAVINGAQELDMWEASYDAANDAWSAGARMMNDAGGWGASCGLGEHCNGAVAAGFSLLGGAVRPEEIAQGHIDHALAITTPYTRSGYIACPATHTDGKYDDPNAIPEGALIQLDPAFDVDAQSWPVWKKVIAKALQNYGAYVADTGGTVAIRGVTDLNLGADTWAASGTPKGGSLADLPWNSFRVLTIRSCN